MKSSTLLLNVPSCLMTTEMGISVRSQTTSQDSSCEVSDTEQDGVTEQDHNNEETQASQEQEEPEVEILKVKIKEEEEDEKPVDPLLIQMNDMQNEDQTNMVVGVPVLRTPQGSPRFLNPDVRVIREEKTSGLQVWRLERTPTKASVSRTRQKSLTPGHRERHSPKRARRALNFGNIDNLLEQPDSGSEPDDLDTDDETEWVRGTALANIRQLSREVRDYAVLEEEGVLEAGEIVPPEDAAANFQETGRPVVDSGDVERPECSNVFDWTDDFSSFSGQAEIYSNTPGPKVTARDPAGLFREVWDLAIIGHIVEETNRYAWQTIAAMSESDQIPKYLEDWKDTTVEEMYIFFAIFNYMAIDYRSALTEYWTTGILGMPEFRQIMSRNRFSILTRFLHFTDNDYICHNTRSYERKLSKIAPILKHCNKKFRAMYTPRRELSLDESLLLWKGRLSWIQCIRSKSARFGIKSFDLCEAETGYLIRTLIYAGQDSSMTRKVIHGFENSTAKVVLELMDGFLDVGHMLVMDNWYNQLPLTRYLKHRHTDVIGTLNRRRINVPQAIKDLIESRVPVGTQLSLHCGDVTCIAWKDVKLVTAVSTCHNGDTVRCRRAGITRQKPILIETYNKYMGGVDKKDSMLSMYSFERKRGQNWYMKVFKRLLNTSLLNTYIIYSQMDTGRPLTHRLYRYRVSEGLLATFQPARVQRPLPSTSSLPISSYESSMSSVPIRLKRGEDFDHFPVHTESDTGKNKHKRRRCANCSRKGKRTSSNTMCETCDVALCISCWKEYHRTPNF